MKRNRDLPLVRSLVIAIFEANGQLVEMGNELVRPAGLTTAWWQVLGALGYAPEPQSVSQIARAMGLTRQAVQRIVDLLVDRGYVTFAPNPHHQRAKLVVLTDAGGTALEMAERAAGPVDRRILDRIGSERLAMALTALNDITDIITEELNREAGARKASPSARKDFE
ncbi:DNA-binding MarR family transcriptional regulator [Rhizobium sp. PP-CC-3A-592]|nr:DNA-binding MarR family transcriptional regulator [Rhizobium sp. PP-CC-3A-592]